MQSRRIGQSCVDRRQRAAKRHQSRTIPRDRGDPAHNVRSDRQGSVQDRQRDRFNTGTSQRRVSIDIGETQTRDRRLDIFDDRLRTRNRRNRWRIVHRSDVDRADEWRAAKLAVIDQVHNGSRSRRRVIARVLEFHRAKGTLPGSRGRSSASRQGHDARRIVDHSGDPGRRRVGQQILTEHEIRDRDRARSIQDIRPVVTIRDRNDRIDRRCRTVFRERQNAAIRQNGSGNRGMRRIAPFVVAPDVVNRDGIKTVGRRSARAEREVRYGTTETTCRNPILRAEIARARFNSRDIQWREGARYGVGDTDSATSAILEIDLAIREVARRGTVENSDGIEDRPTGKGGTVRGAVVVGVDIRGERRSRTGGDQEKGFGTDVQIRARARVTDRRCRARAKSGTAAGVGQVRCARINGVSTTLFEKNQESVAAKLFPADVKNILDDTHRPGVSTHADKICPGTKRRVRRSSKFHILVRRIGTRWVHHDLADQGGDRVRQHPANFKSFHRQRCRMRSRRGHCSPTWLRQTPSLRASDQTPFQIPQPRENHNRTPLEKMTLQPRRTKSISSANRDH